MTALGAEGRRFESCLPDHFSSDYQRLADADDSSRLGETGTNRNRTDTSGTANHGIVTEDVRGRFHGYRRQSPKEIVTEALAHEPIAAFALFSGGDGSLRATHWAMNNVPGCQVAHLNTGIGIRATRLYVRETCDREGWPLVEIRAKEDCGNDYDEIVLKHGFPGPAAHSLMYRLLKERCVEELVRRYKWQWRDKIMLLTGIQHDDSKRRSGYGNDIIKLKGAQMWVNHVYWSTTNDTYHYLREHRIPRNPVSEELGMSGECGCGAFAAPGELEIWRRVDPEFGRRIDYLQIETAKRGLPCRWDDRPPRRREDERTIDMFNPLCTHCIKRAA